MPLLRPALFLDRDGVLNVDRGYVSRVEDFVWVEGAIDCIKAFNARNWLVFVVTNQSAIAFGDYTIDDMNRVHEHLLKELEAAGGKLDRIYYSPWHPDGSDPRYRRLSEDRKPGPGMLRKAMREFPVKADESFLIGDKQTDLSAAQAAGIDAVLFEGGNLARFAEAALSDLQKRRGG